MREKVTVVAEVEGSTVAGIRMMMAGARVMMAMKAALKFSWVFEEGVVEEISL